MGVNLLVEQDFATADLADAIIESTKATGPYYVLAPKLALAHVIPGSYNKKVGLSLILFKKAVQFSDQSRHDVNLLFTLSALDGESHMNKIMKFAQLFSDPNVVEQAINATSKDELYEIVKEVFND